MTSAPFEEDTWVDQAREWVRACVPAATGLYTLERASAAGRVLRFQTDIVPVWLKAVGPSSNEPQLTMALARWEPESCLPAFAHRPEWGAWLSHDVAGRTLTFDDGCARWAQAVQRMAGLQARSVARESALLALGCRDYRLRTLGARLDWLIDLTGRLMTDQPVAPPPRLNASQLERIRESLCRILSTSIEAGIPDVLTHTDWGPHNVLVDDRGGCRLIDWAGACLAPAPVCFTWLLVKFERRWPEYLNWRPQLDLAFEAQWSGVVNLRTRAAMPTVAPMLAMLVRAFRDADLYTGDPERYRERAALLRSLARLMLAHAGSVG